MSIPLYLYRYGNDARKVWIDGNALLRERT